MGDELLGLRPDVGGEDGGDREDQRERRDGEAEEFTFLDCSACTAASCLCTAASRLCSAASRRCSASSSSYLREYSRKASSWARFSSIA